MSRLDEIADTLKQRDFIVSSQVPDTKNLGNWTMIAGRLNLVVRVTSNRGDILLDLMPLHRFRPPSTESDWFNWGVVARTLGIAKTTKGGPIRSFLEHFYMIDQAFAPQNWTQTAALLSAFAEEEPRTAVNKKP
jgi:hypothetical protein